jgi:hypothetical protein
LQPRNNGGVSEKHQLDPWEPLSVDGVAKLFSAATFPWWIAGGHAIELAAGRHVRKHSDIDVLVLRRDHESVRHCLADWDSWAVEPEGSFSEWRRGELLPQAVHDIWCRERPAGAWRLQLMLDEADGTRWQSRRDARVTRPVAELGLLDSNGIPYLAPETQLYYKAKNPRPIDEIDFSAALPVMSSRQRAWLAESITKTYGEGHRWLARLEESSAADYSNA